METPTLRAGKCTACDKKVASGAAWISHRDSHGPFPPSKVEAEWTPDAWKGKHPLYICEQGTQTPARGLTLLLPGGREVVCGAYITRTRKGQSVVCHVDDAEYAKVYKRHGHRRSASVSVDRWSRIVNPLDSAYLSVRARGDTAILEMELDGKKRMIAAFINDESEAWPDTDRLRRDADSIGVPGVVFGHSKHGISYESINKICDRVCDSIEVVEGWGYEGMMPLFVMACEHEYIRLTCGVGNPYYWDCATTYEVDRMRDMLAEHGESAWDTVLLRLNHMKNRLVDAKEAVGDQKKQLWDFVQESGFNWSAANKCFVAPQQS